jgi:hypothetical protein
VVAGLAAVLVTAGLGRPEKTAQSTYTIRSGSNRIVIAVPGSTNAQAYCISWVSAGHWAHIDGPGGQVTHDPAATTDPCAGRNG